MRMSGVLVLIGLLVANAAGPLSAQSAADYVVGPQDVLTIQVFDQPDLGGKYTVEADGTFTFPLIGRVKAGGLTLRGFEKRLKKRLADGFFKNPQVTVAVEQYRSQRVFVMGEVRSPGRSADRRHDAHRGARARRLDAPDQLGRGRRSCARPQASGAGPACLPGQDAAHGGRSARASRRCRAAALAERRPPRRRHHLRAARRDASTCSAR